MADERWQNLIFRDRMTVDQEFTNRIQQSRFNQQEWGMIMSAVEFSIEGQGDDARLVADTQQIKDILPHVDNMNRQMSSYHGTTSSGGLIDSIKSVLGLGGGSQNGVDQAALSEATALVEEYAMDLQSHLERTNKWHRVLDAANN